VQNTFFFKHLLKCDLIDYLIEIKLFRVIINIKHLKKKFFFFFFMLIIWFISSKLFFLNLILLFFLLLIKRFITILLK
jgi:hypothetical protein